MITKIIKKVVDIPSNIINIINLKYRNIVKGHDMVINGEVSFHGSGNIVIGNNVTINSGIRYNPSSGDLKTSISVYDGAILKIGNNTGISNAAITAKKGIIIGNDVLIGSGCMITDTDFHSLESVSRKSGDENIKSSAIVIKDSVFIGAKSIILKGVTIGENSVVGAGSVVTKNIPRNEVWGGESCKIYKKYRVVVN